MVSLWESENPGSASATTCFWGGRKWSLRERTRRGDGDHFGEIPGPSTLDETDAPAS